MRAGWNRQHIPTFQEKELLELIDNLPEGYRLVFNLYVIEGYPHEEIANILGIQPGTSRSQLVKARNMLKNQLLNLQKWPGTLWPQEEK